MELIRHLFEIIRDPQNSNAIVAIFTVLIFLTGFAYTIFAALQWDQMRKATKATQRQIGDSEAVQSARLIIEDFRADVTQGQPGQGTFITGNFVVTNVGPTVASEIYETHATGGSVMPPEALPTLKPTPVPNGPSLAPGKSRSYAIAVQEGSWEQVQQGKWFWSFSIAVSYKDIFGKSTVISDCFVYNRKAAQFVRCAVAVPELGFVPADLEKKK